MGPMRALVPLHSGALILVLLLPQPPHPIQPLSASASLGLFLALPPPAWGSFSLMPLKTPENN